MKRNYVAGNDYEFAIKFKDGEQRSFFGRLSERAPVSNAPKGDVVLTFKNNGCVIVEKDHRVLDMIPQDIIEEIATFIEEKELIKVKTCDNIIS